MIKYKLFQSLQPTTTSLHQLLFLLLFMVSFLSCYEAEETLVQPELGETTTITIAPQEQIRINVDVESGGDYVLYVEALRNLDPDAPERDAGIVAGDGREAWSYEHQGPTVTFDLAPFSIFGPRDNDRLPEASFLYDLRLPIVLRAGENVVDVRAFERFGHDSDLAFELSIYQGEYGPTTDGTPDAPTVLQLDQTYSGYMDGRAYYYVELDPEEDEYHIEIDSENKQFIARVYPGYLSAPGATSCLGLSFFGSFGCAFERDATDQFNDVVVEFVWNEFGGGGRTVRGPIEITFHSGLFSISPVF